MKARARQTGTSRPAIGPYIYNKVEHKPLYIIRYRGRSFASSCQQISLPFPITIGHQLTSGARHGNGRIKKERNGSTKERRERVRQRKEKTEGGYSFPDKRHTPRQGRITVMTPASRDREIVKKISMTFASFSPFKMLFRKAFTASVQPANEVRQNRKIGASAKEYTCKGKRIYIKRQSSIMLERQVTIGYFAK